MGGICGKSKVPPKRLFAAQVVRTEREAAQASHKGEIQIISLARLFNMLTVDNNSQHEKYFQSL